ncbi:MAG: competence/damage-inducible protein A [Rhodospirillaceae bacterium]|nr:competence/damage-inducible protein A [Rhodospirillaceae bacterium]
MTTSSSSNPTACVLIIGDEVLSGRTQDANLKFLAERLGQLGIPLGEARVIPDIEAKIVEALNACRKEYTYVFTTGGIGPTHDDITTACVAKAFGRKVIRHPEVEKKLRAYYGERTNEARLRMAEVPDGDGVSLIENLISVAPGYRIDNVFVLAGVPSVARAMFEAVAPTLRGGPPVYSQSIDAHVREGDIAAGLAEIQAQHTNVAVGSYPFMRLDKLGTSIVARSTDRAGIAAVIGKVEKLMRGLGADPVVGPAPV